MELNYIGQCCDLLIQWRMQYVTQHMYQSKSWNPLCECDCYLKPFVIRARKRRIEGVYHLRSGYYSLKTTLFSSPYFNRGSLIRWELERLKPHMGSHFDARRNGLWDLWLVLNALFYKWVFSFHNWKLHPLPWKSNRWFWRTGNGEGFTMRQMTWLKQILK